ncbi:HpcH/HpaI aldolase/citrate lyase family protein [Amycolatopsis sacchari]|uniref:HpcH/HpaI aldolase/citrate lyase family protein n=1 Tax=Amycolatopsis sacchari TaxID=115433 RepID=UPI003D759523
MTEFVAHARTFLFVPGHRPDRFPKAHADVVVLDLEDAVGPDQKVAAREHVRAWLAGGHPAMVRINPPGTPWHEEDLALAVEHGCPVMLPKAEDPAVLAALGVSAGVVPLVETAAGIARAAEVCAAPGVVRPAFGSVDLAAQLGVDHRSHEALRYARSALVVAAAAAGRAAPVDGVTTALDDEDALVADLEHALTLGLTAKLCVHPRQVPVVHRRLAPTPEEVAWARGVLAAAEDGSVAVFEGQMIDRPVVLRAQAVLARAPG